MPIVDLPLEQLKEYTPALTSRKDFHLFWQQNIKLSKDQPLNATLKRIEYPIAKIEAYAITIDGFIDKTPICGWFLKPSGEKELPALMFYHGYGGNKGTVSDYIGWALQGYAIMAVDVRGQSGDSPDFARYPAGSLLGNMTKGILDKQTYYYRMVYMDCLRALDFLLDMEHVRDDRVGVTGVSQGGGLTLTIAALESRIKIVLSEVPYLCNFERAINVATEGPYLEILHFMKAHPDDVERMMETLSYFDAMNFAPDIKCPSLVSVGLIDTICPASTIFAAYHHLASDKKELSIYPGMGHESLNYHQEKKIAWAANYLLG